MRLEQRPSTQQHGTRYTCGARTSMMTDTHSLSVVCALTHSVWGRVPGLCHVTHALSGEQQQDSQVSATAFVQLFETTHTHSF